MGGSSSNSDLYFFGNFVFFCVFCVVFMFPNVSKNLTKPLRETVYLSLVRSSLEYYSGVWDFFKQKYIDTLKKGNQQDLSLKIIDEQPVSHSFRTWAGLT